MIRHESEKADLLVLNCGGTASQFRDDSTYNLRRMDVMEIINGVHKDITSDRRIRGVTLWPGINSSNIASGEHLQPLAARLATARNEFRSAVIIMGTNTAAYVGSYLTFALRGLDIPIVIASGQRHHGREGSDSDRNINDAFKLALAGADYGARGVFIHAGSESRRLLRAVGAEKQGDNVYGIYDSPCMDPVAYITPHQIDFDPSILRADTEEPFQLLNDFTTEGILPINVIPDFNPFFIDAVASFEGCRAIILKTYETGNVPDLLLPPIQRAVRKGIRVVAVPTFAERNLTYLIPPEEQNIYNKIGEDMESGYAAPGNMTMAALCNKVGFWLTYHERLDLGDLGHFLDQNYAGEIPTRRFSSVDTLATIKERQRRVLIQ